MIYGSNVKLKKEKLILMEKFSRYPACTAESIKQFLESNEHGIVTKFEAAFLNQVPGEYAIAVNSATSGLHAALFALGGSPGD